MDKATITRTAVLALALINQLLTALGFEVLPLNDAELTNIIAWVFTSIAAVSAWWKDNPITPEAKQAKEYLKSLKQGKKAKKLAKKLGVDLGQLKGQSPSVTADKVATEEEAEAVSEATKKVVFADGED